MTGFFRRSGAIGLSILLLGGLGPIARAADAPTTSAQPPASTEPAVSAEQSPLVSTSAITTTATPTQTYSQLPSDFGLEISPVRLEVPQSDIAKVQQLNVINRGRKPVTVLVRKQGFIGAADGTMKLEPNAPHSAVTWVTVTPSTLTLAPGTARAVDITIAVPKDADPGDHEVALVFVSPSPKGAGNIVVDRGIATPIYITVPGPTVQAVSLDTLVAKGFTTGGGVTFTATLHNTGTVHRDFRGATTLEIVGAGRVAKFPEFTMVRGSTRTVSATWYPPFMCICYPSVSLPQADGSIQITSVRVIVFPVQWAVALLLALLLLAFAIRLNRRRFHSRVLNAARAMNQAIS